MRSRPTLPVRHALRLALVAAVLASCATSPLGRKQLRLLSGEQVAGMGATAFQEIKQQTPQASDAATTRYVRCVADAIAAQASGPGAPAQWEVVVFAEDEANAFALPGGKIGVYTGIVEVAKNQDQLATVIGHEVAHVLAQHANERVSQQVVAGALMEVAGQALDPRLAAALGVGAQVGVLLPFSRTQESEADLLGLDLMASAGFDPRQSVPFWQNMEKAGGAGAPEFLSTHPSGTTRMRDLNERIPQSLQLYEQAVAAGRRPRCG
ncbi:MAG: M48 family metallopeptidase [Thermodesulfobacteriota bacterium]